MKKKFREITVDDKKYAWAVHDGYENNIITIWLDKKKIYNKSVGGHIKVTPKTIAEIIKDPSYEPVNPPGPKYVEESMKVFFILEDLRKIRNKYEKGTPQRKAYNDAIEKVDDLHMKLVDAFERPFPVEEENEFTKEDMLDFAADQRNRNLHPTEKTLKDWTEYR